MADNKTIYQKLNGFFNIGGFDTDNQQTNMSQSTVQQEKSKIIIKGNSPEEIHRKGLELEQKRKLQDKFFRTTDRGFQKALQYEAARLPAYIDYEGMEYYPIISSALDLYMEEATSIGFNGKMLNIYSDKERIKNLLEDFFYNVVNVNVNLPFWTRNLVKYGDNFVLLYGERKKGINNVKQMVNYEIERFERIQNGKPVIKFKERMTGDEFNVFEIAHFRLLGDDKYLPYGSSALNKVRRVFRQLVMAEDAMLTYRIIRAGEKKVFKIDVGNIDDDDIEDYIYKVATKFKKVGQVSPNDGQIDYRFNILGNDEDYFLPVRNANVETGIETLPGATNLDAIQDIEYLRDNLFIGLGIPKPFLSFQDAAGAGKNMAQYDIRFAKKVNRIQQALIQELNKMAMVHLFLLGYSAEDVGDFQLTLTNPSIQEEILKSELMRDKSTAYGDLTRGDNGIAAMSHTQAKKLIFNMSDADIITDLKQQKMEKTVMQELADAPITIKKSGLFTDLDNRFGTPTTEGEPNPEDGNVKGEEGNIGNEESSIAPPDAGAGVVGGVPEPPDAGIALGEGRMSLDEFENYVTNMVNSSSKEKIIKIKKKEERKKVITENNNVVKKQNENAVKMIGEIDGILETSKSISFDEEINNIDLEVLSEES